MGRVKPRGPTSPSIGGRPGWRALVASYVVLTLLASFAFGPITIALFAALKSRVELADDPLGPPPEWRWSNFATAWQLAHMGDGFASTLIVVAGTILGVCVIAGCAAYAMARLDLPGARAVMVCLIIGGAMPIQLFLVRLFFLWTELGLYDSLFGLIVVYWGIFSPYATLLLRSFFLRIPRDVEDAARLDGASEWAVLTRITLPLSWPGFFTVALTTGIAAYNEFLLASTFIQSEDRLPVATRFFAFRQGLGQDYPMFSAAGLVMLLPVLVVFLVLQRRFIDGFSTAQLR
jgi:raffinose/stachyose/melibiose transport system permease protein